MRRPGYGFDIALIAALIVLNALFAGTEIALPSLRESQLRRSRKGGGARAARLVRLTQDPNRFLATIQIGITPAGFLASATAAVSLTEPLKLLPGFVGRAAEPLAIALVTLVLTFVTLVAGELAPKRLAMQYAQRWALLWRRTPLDALATAAPPAVWALSRATDLLVRLFGGDPRETGRPPSSELRAPRSCVTWPSADAVSPWSSAPSSPGLWRSTNAPCAPSPSRAMPCSPCPTTCRPPRSASNWTLQITDIHQHTITTVLLQSVSRGDQSRPAGP